MATLIAKTLSMWVVNLNATVDWHTVIPSVISLFEPWDYVNKPLYYA